MRAAFTAAMCAALAGCGYVGDPLPPSLDIPQPVTDLRAFEYGDKVIVQFTLPELSTEALPLRSLQAVEVFAGPTGAVSIDEWAGQARKYPLPVPKTGALEHEVPASDWAGREIELRVRAVGPKGRASDWSNMAALNVIQPLALPTNVGARNVREGVALSWQGNVARYRVFRASAGGEPQPLGETEAPEYVDQSSIYGVTYRYQVQAFASASQQGVLTEPVSIIPSDTFAPEVPAGLSGLASGVSVELAWQPNSDEDLAGYNVYRALDQGEFAVLEKGVRSPAYSDTKTEAGRRYRYAVTAVDATGNESERSMPVEVVAP